MENLGNGETEEEWERCTGAKFDLQICDLLRKLYPSSFSNHLGFVDRDLKIKSFKVLVLG